MRATLLALVLWLPCAAFGQDADPVSTEGTGGSGAAPASFLVVVDAGHGGKQDGAVSPRGEKEKNVALQIARRLKESLEKAGAKVLLTRDADVDVDLWDRMPKANGSKAELFVSVHLNAMPVGPSRAVTHGIETYFLSAEATGEQARRVAAQENGEARRAKVGTDPLANILEDLAQTEAHHEASALAYAVHQRLVKDLGAADRGVQQAPFIVLMGAQMPAILVEVGFLSHPAESRRLSDKDYQGRIADSLVAGIAAFREDVARRRKAPEAAAKPAASAKVP